MPTATARPRRKRLTERDLLQMPSDGRKYELVNGRLQIVPTGARHGEIVSNLIGRLHAAKPPTVALYSEAVGFRMHSGNIRSPDTVVMRRERLPDGVSPDEFIDGAPDLAAEVVSPSERAAELLQKVAEYFSPIAIPLWDSHPKRKNES
jgi:Uma2 family endonuclease